jgi:hypothetical protein
VSADVADQHVQVVGGGLHDIVEIPTEQRPVAAGPVQRPHRRARAAHQRLGQQAPLQPGRLGLLHLDLTQPTDVVVGTLALDGVAQSPAQQHPVDLALDQVVLGALADGGDAEVLIVQAGEHADRDAAGRVQHVAQAAETGRVGQPEVEQDAVHRCEPGPRGCHVRRDLQVDLGAGLGEQFLDEERVTGIVFDQQHPQPFTRPGRRRTAEVAPRRHLEPGGNPFTVHGRTPPPRLCRSPQRG